MSDRIAVMHAGKVEQLGTPEELYERPATRFVADFIGSTNLLRGRIEADGRVRLDVGRGRPRRARRHGRPAPRSRSASARRRSRSSRPAPRTPSGDRRTGRLSRDDHLLPTPHGGRTRPDRAVTQDRGQAARSAAMWPSPGHRPRHSSSAAVRSGHEEETIVNDPRDISDQDIERALERYLTEQRMTRRELLERIGVVGAAVALAPIVAACARPARHRRPAAPSVAAPPPRRAPSAAAATATPEPTPVPSPEAELIVYNWLDYIGEDVIPSFEEKYPVKVKYELFDDIEVAYDEARRRRERLRHLVPDLGRHPALHRRPARSSSSTSRSCRTSSTSAPQWPNPGYDPGNEHSVPYVWWTTGVGYDTTKVTDSPTSSKALWDPRYKGHISMMDDYQETFGLALIQLGYSANTTDTAQLDEALALLKQQKPLAADVQQRHGRDDARRRRLDRHDLGLGPVPDHTRRTRTSSTTSPRRAASAARTPRRSTRAPSTRSRRTCSSTTCSTPRSAPRTRTSSATWARTRRPRSSSTRRSWPIRRSTRTRRSSTSSRSCSTCRTRSTRST